MTTVRKARPYRGMAMEGIIATWYAKNTGKSIAEFKTLAERIAAELEPGSRVLEVAPGPGYLAVALAKRGYQVTGIDVSRSFVRIARDTAMRDGVSVDFREGDAAALPFSAGVFDFVVCRAAFKNFSDPAAALGEMHRVLRAGGTALIVDLRKDASASAISDAVTRMNLGAVDAFATRTTLALLRRRAYSRPDFERMAQASPFGRFDILEAPLAFEVRLVR